MSISIDILSDPICPWCYIGKTRLEQAFADRPEHGFDVTWRPFQLNPDMPPEGMDRRRYLERKFGGPEGATRVYGAIADAARASGLDLDLDGIKRTPNTLDAHRLLRWAYVEGRQDAVATGLFRAYFQDGQDISAHDVLGDIAEKAGLDRAAIAALLSGEADRDAVRQEDSEARAAGVNSAPTFIVAGKYVVPGAQEPDLWVRVIDEVKAGALAL